MSDPIGDLRREQERQARDNAAPAGPEGTLSRYEEVSNRPGYAGDWRVWGDDANRTYQMAYDSFKQMFGRAPTQNEFSMAMGAFQGPNSQITGRSYLANLQQQYQQNPLLDPSNPRHTTRQDPNAIGQSVQQQFQSILGRQATKEELDHFTEAIRSNQIDGYGLSSFLKQQPEYTNAQDKTFRGGLNDELAGYDQTAFNRSKGDILSEYASRGITQSPSLDFALTDMMGKLAEKRNQFLSGVSAQQYGGNKDLAVGNYKNTLDQFYNESQGRRQGQREYGQSLIERGFAGADYGQQMRDYMNQMNSERSARNTLHGSDWINLGMQAANAGAQAYTGFAYLNKPTGQRG